MRAEAEPAGRDRPRPRRAVAPIALAGLILLAVADCRRPPAHQLGAALAVAAIDGYRAAVSPLLARSGVIRCRFRPSCSAYGREAIVRYGMPRGALLAAGRILRCNPFSKGGEDPVP